MTTQSSEKKSIEDLSEVLKCLRPLESSWYILGVHLKIKKDILDRIEADHQQKGVQRCLTEVISHWQQNEDPSWEKLANSVENVGGYENVVKLVRTMSIPSTRAEDLEESGYGSSQSASHSASDSEQDVFDTPLSPECGCGECNIYKICTDGCPRPDYTKRLQILTKFARGSTGENVAEIASKMCSETSMSYDHHQCLVDYCAAVECNFEMSANQRLPISDPALNFEEKTADLSDKFGRLVTDTCRSLKTHVDKADAALYLLNTFPLLKQKSIEIMGATDMTELFTEVTVQACSWFDFDIIKRLIGKFGKDDDHQRLVEYEKHFQTFAKQRLPQGLTHVELGSKAGMTGCKKLVIKIDRYWGSISIGELEQLCREFAKILEIDRKNLYLADVNKGCIMLTMMVPEEIANTLSQRKLTRAQKQMLASERVVRLNCAGLKWSRSSNTQHDSSSDSEEEMEVRRSQVHTRLHFNLKEYEHVRQHCGSECHLMSGSYDYELSNCKCKISSSHNSSRPKSRVAAFEIIPAARAYQMTETVCRPLWPSTLALTPNIDTEYVIIGLNLFKLGKLLASVFRAYKMQIEKEQQKKAARARAREEGFRQLVQYYIYLSESIHPHLILHISGHYSHDSGRKYLLSPSMDHRFLKLQNGKESTET